MTGDVPGGEHEIVRGTATLLAEIGADFGDPEITPEIRYLALLALHDTLPLARPDIRILAAAVVRKLLSLR